MGYYYVSILVLIGRIGWEICPHGYLTYFAPLNLLLVIKQKTQDRIGKLAESKIWVTLVMM